MHEPDTSLPGVSTRQAAIILGTSESDVRRRIRRGELRAESVARPGGTLLRVLIDAPGAATAADPTPSTPHAPDTRQDAPAAISALVDALAAEREERQRLSAENAELRERIGRAEGQVIAANAERDARGDALELVQAQLDQARAEVERLRARRWWKWW